MSGVAEIFERPNGKLYRPRKPNLVAHAWENEYDGDHGVIVFGTLDPDKAREFAVEMCGYWYGADGVTGEAPGWYRNGFECGQRTWLQDPHRGRPGVSFQAVHQ